MKIETIQDPNIFNHDFKAPWLNDISYEEWCKFLAHNYAYGREEAYHVVRDFVGKRYPPGNRMGISKPTFLEIGFGNGYDFEHCFQHLYDIGYIIYKGWEITEQFVKYAKKKFYHQDSCFSLGGFDDLVSFEPYSYVANFDIIYTRHTLEHQHPHNGYDYFANLLRATRELAIVTWFISPGEEAFRWNDRDGDGRGAYINTYSDQKLKNLIRKYGFNLKIIFIQYKRIYNEMWVMRKK